MTKNYIPSYNDRIHYSVVTSILVDNGYIVGSPNEYGEVTVNKPNYTTITIDEIKNLLNINKYDQSVRYQKYGKIIIEVNID